MKVLFVSNDPTIFSATSPARARMRAYAALVEELHIVSAASFSAREEREGNLYLHPIHAWKLFRVHALAKRARMLILERGIEVVSAQDPFEHGLAALRAVCDTEAKLHIQVHTDFLSPWFVRDGNWRSPRVAMPLLNRWRRSVADRVLFLGQVSHTLMPKYLKISDIFIRPSRSEGFGISFIEAMVAGLPVIATQEGGIADFLFDAKRNPGKETTGWAVDCDSPEQIAEKVKEILANPEQAKKIVATARKYVRDNFDWDVIVKKMETLFDEACTRRL